MSRIPDINSSEALANEEGKKRGRFGQSNSVVTFVYVHHRKRKASSQEKSSNKLEVPTGGRKRKRKSSEIKAEDGYVSGSSGADDHPQEVRKSKSSCDDHLIACNHRYKKLPQAAYLPGITVYDSHVHLCG